MELRRLLIYNDSPVFGGHEIMLLHHLENSLLDWPGEVFFFYSADNLGLDRLLKNFRFSQDKLNLVPVKFVSKSMQRVRDINLSQKVRELADHFSAINPDLVLVVQGNIELCSLGLLASNKGKLRTISYIPLAHGFKETGRRLGLLRDLLNRKLYALPDTFITICASQKRLLERRGVPAEKVVIVNNFVQNVPSDQIDQSQARERFGLPGKRFLFGVIGRIQFCQKSQEFLVRAFARNISRLPGSALVVIGSGPDEVALHQLVAQLENAEHVHIIPWQSDTAAIYSALDALVIPSRFEGVPLVMIEAVQAGLPVIASDVDGMSENLPSEWLFCQGDAGQLVDRMHFVLTTDQVLAINTVKSTFLSKFNRILAAGQFQAALGIVRDDYEG